MIIMFKRSYDSYKKTQKFRIKRTLQECKKETDSDEEELVTALLNNQHACSTEINGKCTLLYYYYSYYL